MDAITSHQASDDLTIGAIVKIVVKWYKYLLGQWLKLLIAGIIGGILGVLLAWFSPVTYSANLSFILEEGKANGGGLSSIAGSLGVDLGGMSSSSNMLAGDNIIGLLKSRRFTEEALLTAYDPAQKYSLADKYADIYNLRRKWKSNSKIGKEIFFPVRSAEKNYTRLQDSLLQVIENAILKEQLVVERSDKKMTFFGVTTTFRDELLAKYFSERLILNTIEFYIETKTRRLRTNVDRLQHRADSLVALLNNRTYSAAAAQSRVLDVNPAYQTAVVAAEVSQRDKTVAATIYAEIVKNLEIQKVTLGQETPVIQVVDGAQLPLIKNKASRFTNGLQGAFIGFFLLSFLLLLLKFFRNQNSLV